MSRGDAGAARAVALDALDADGAIPTPIAARGSRDGEGERRLVAAVLEDAIACFQHHRMARRPSVRRLYEDAEAWLFGTDGAPFSFEYICQVLTIDADWLRAGLFACEANALVTARVGASAGAALQQATRNLSPRGGSRPIAMARPRRSLPRPPRQR